VRRRFAGWHAPVAEVVDATDPGDVLRHDIFDLRPRPARLVRGRLLLLGDAAHAMTPDLGQGACQALEDAATLGALVRPGADLDAALLRYDACRRPRVRLVARRSRQLGRVGQLDGRLTAPARDLLVRATPDGLTARQLDGILGWQSPACP
jgi:2-polyprenyl-6-methoxyphenol hydroxylase-like FAD-dependent oxidoreductase